MPYEGSDNFIWEGRLLGKGTSGHVYLGYNKKSASKCAVKVFKTDATRHALQELDVVRKLKHVNIVELLGIEKNTRTGEDVLILEYCNHGNLHDLLKKPEFAYGLPENEVRSFLIQMGDGMQYLHSEVTIIHRDWKPGNIMCCRERGDGRMMYKIADFGTAKALEKDCEEFPTLHGTVEYLHPVMLKDMVERRNIRKTGGTYSTKSDLWSFGATLYQVITGSLPFVVAGGRRDNEGMSEMTSNKPANAISGRRDEHGNIEWKEDFPATCRLSQSMRQMLQVLLVNLLQTDITKGWDFHTFFSYIEDSFKMRTLLHAFSVPTCVHHCLYMKPTDTLPHVKETIAQLTNIRAADQVLVLDGHFVEEAVKEMWPVGEYPATSEDNPIIVLEAGVQTQGPWEAADLAQPDVPEFKPNSEKDPQTAAEMCALAQLTRRDSQRIQLCSRLLDRILMLSGSILQTEQFYKERIAYLLYHLVDETQRHLQELLELVCDARTLINNTHEKPSLTLEERNARLRHDFEGLRHELKKLEQQVLPHDSRETSSIAGQNSLFGLASALWIRVSDDVQRTRDHVSEESLEALVEEVQERSVEIKSHCSKQSLDNNEKQILKVEKYYIRKTTEQAMARAKSQQHNLRRKHHHSRGWIRNFVKQRDRKKSLELRIIECEIRRKQLRDKYEKDYRELWQRTRTSRRSDAQSVT